MKLFLIKSAIPLLAILFVPLEAANAQGWTAKLDKSVRFYQTTDLGVVLVSHTALTLLGRFVAPAPE